MKKKKLTISNRLWTLFIVSTLIPSILITAMLCINYVNDYKKSASTQMQAYKDLIVNYVNTFTKDIETATMAPYYHSYFSSSSSINPDNEHYISEVNSFQNEMINLLSLTTYSHSDIYDTIVWSDGLYLYSVLFNELWYSTIDITQTNYFIHGMEGKGKIKYSPATIENDRNAPIDTSFFYVTRKIINPKQPNQTNMIIMNFKAKEFDKVFSEMEILNNAFIVITNERQELIYSSKAINQVELESIIHKKTLSYEGNNYECIRSTLTSPGLTVYLSYSLKEMTSQISIIVLTSIIIYLAGILFATFLYRNFSSWISKSAENLKSTFVEMENGDLTVRCPESEIEEFDDIGNSVNKAIEQLNEKINNEYLMQIKAKNDQLYVLQSQIQPHFLINTIYNLIALNQIGEKERLNTSFYSLASLMRYIMSKEIYVDLEKELGFLDNYLQLQQLRYGAKLSYTISCPDKLKQMTVPRMILQPLVENAIKHGIEPSESPCYCNIRVEENENAVLFYVEDNGTGFKSQLEAEELITNSTPTNGDGTRSTSVGIYYVRERLSMWVPKASIDVNTKPITQFIITIPKEES